mgnify:CR=1 FL=1
MLNRVNVKLQMASEIAPPEANEAEGCVQCQRGSKLVLFVTGRCHWGCDYCPLSENRRESPDMFANERRCQNFDEVIEEGRAMRATGTGITGGDPMLDFDKTVEAVRALKDAFGPEHHIHCYTSIPIKPAQAKELGEAGLDELRFHLLDLTLDRYRDSINAASEAGICVGIELPAEPDKHEKMHALLQELHDSPVEFLNLNELEITVGNQHNMDVRGFNLAGGITAAVQRTDINYDATGTNDQEAMHVGVSFAVNENLSVSAGRQKVEIDTAVDNEVNTGVSASYTMGSITIGGGFNEVESAGGAANSDAEVTMLNLAFAF